LISGDAPLRASNRTILIGRCTIDLYIFASRMFYLNHSTSSVGRLNMDCETWRIGSGRIYAYVQSYKDELKVHLRNCQFVESGRCFPSKRGVALNFEEWESLKSLVQTIDSEFRRQLSQRKETIETRPPWFYGSGEISDASSNGNTCMSFENNN